MNRNEFLNMMEDTIPLNRQMIGDVYELIEIFPYFQSAHLLLLKGLRNSADVKFENQLRNSAIHIADREVLYYLLRREAVPADLQRETVSEKKSDTEPLSDTLQTVIESAKNSEDLISEYEKTSGESDNGSSLSADTQLSGHSILIGYEEDNEVPAGVMLLLDEESSPSPDKLFYMDPGFSVPEQGDLLELDLNDNQPVNDVEANFKDDKESSEDKFFSKKSQFDLIDKFIIANPRIEPNREKSSVPADDISKPYIEEKGGFVTETLARIYISQGYYSKAIDIYEKLSLKFPEKSSYFASQIEKVKEYIKK